MLVTCAAPVAVAGHNATHLHDWYVGRGSPSPGRSTSANQSMSIRCAATPAPVATDDAAPHHRGGPSADTSATTLPSGTDDAVVPGQEPKRAPTVTVGRHSPVLAVRRYERPLRSGPRSRPGIDEPKGPRRRRPRERADA